MSKRARRSKFPPPEAKALGTRIRELRKARKWTQEDLAAATDFEVSYIGGLEAGLRNPTLRNLVSVAKGLRVKLPELFEF